MKDNSLQNVENYKKDSNDLAVSYNEMDIYMKYVNVINQYLLFGIETIKNQNLEYLKYILIKGLFTISHVFKMLLLFTQNLDLTYHHCQKSYSYYIEFIGQIGDDAVTYLQLNSKDAALFVYKKTIFDINQEYKKNYYETKTEEIKNNIVSMLIEMYNKIIETELTQLTPEQLQQYRPPESLGETRGPSLTVNDMKKLADEPIQSMLPMIMEEDLPVLARMNLVIFTTEDDIGFVTSDHPCVWFDPGGRRPPMLQSRTIEVSMPLSPNSLALLCWEDFPNYKNMSLLEVDNSNRFQQMACDEYFVVRRNATKPVWFT